MNLVFDPKCEHKYLLGGAFHAEEAIFGSFIMLTFSIIIYGINGKALGKTVTRSVTLHSIEFLG